MGSDRNGWQPTGHALHEHQPEQLPHGGQHHDVRGGEDVRQLVVVVPARQEDVAGSRAPDRFERMLVLPLARKAAKQDKRGRHGEGSPRSVVSGDEEAQALDSGEAPDVEQHRPLSEGVQRVSCIAH